VKFLSRSMNYLKGLFKIELLLVQCHILFFFISWGEQVISAPSNPDTVDGVPCNNCLM
jgi:hypothetical protein